MPLRGSHLSTRPLYAPHHRSSASFRRISRLGHNRTEHLHASSSADPERQVFQREDVREAVERLREEGHEVRVRVTYDGDDATEFAQEAVRREPGERPQVIVAGGGDGTVNQVVAAALEADPATDCAFGVLPLGTANDFATGLGLPVDDLVAALKLCATGTPRPIDVGRINGRVFVNVASGGSVTRITRETDPRAKRLLGGAAYLIAGASRLGELSPMRAAFTADGFSWEGDFIAMAIGNGRLAGGGVPLCADARIDDGRLDLTLFPQPRGGASDDAAVRPAARGGQSVRRLCPARRASPG